MTTAIVFATPLLLLGVLAAAIPFVLHLLSSVRAQEVLFPTLRFLRLSMEKTARRRRIQHWLLLALRAALLGLLAMAVAEPITRAAGGWLGGNPQTAVLILDNSLSMAAKTDSATRFTTAAAEAEALLSGEEKPGLAALLMTNGGPASPQLSSRLDTVRDGIARARVSSDVAPIAARFREAVDLLQKDSQPQKSVYIFSDLQRISFEELAAELSPETVEKAKGVHLFVVNCAGPKVDNVGISDLRIAGPRVVDAPLEFTATLVNSCPTDRAVDVALRVEGQAVGGRVRKELRAAGQEGSTATVRFQHRFRKSGTASGEVFLDLVDDLAADNVRRFSLDIGGRVGATIVRGPSGGAGGMMDPAAMLQIALDPYADKTTPWPIALRTVEAGQFSAAGLAKSDIAFFCDVPSFSEAQAREVEQFVKAGGSAVFFLGPQADAKNYNERFVQQAAVEGGLLPARLGKPVGEVGPEAQATPVEWVEMFAHPFFENLYENHADYLTVLVQRHYRLESSARPGQVLMRLAGGDPLLVTKPYGQGRVILCTTTASPRWTNFPVAPIFLPMASRMALLARREFGRDNTYLAGSQVLIRPGGTGGEEIPDGAAVDVTLPADPDGKSRTVTVPLQKTAEGAIATFTDTSAAGVYRWQLSTGGDNRPAGAFAVNGNGRESQLEAMPAETFRRAMQSKGIPHVYVATSVAAAHAAATAEAQGHNWWDLILAAVILLLVVEAVAANRRQSDEAIPSPGRAGIAA